jgi:hypothetical protein
VNLFYLITDKSTILSELENVKKTANFYGWKSGWDLLILDQNQADYEIFMGI